MQPIVKPLPKMYSDLAQKQHHNKKSIYSILVMAVLLIMTTHYPSNAQAQEFALALNQASQWRMINDTVMGGISASRLTIDKGTATFSGTLSLEQNGGFASTRTSLSTPVTSDINMIRLQVKGDGRDYQLRLRIDNQWDSFAYSSSFHTQKNSWITLLLSPSDFTAVYRGRSVDAPALNFNNIKQLGFLVADKQAGEFELSFKEINFICAD
ncbi:CIA30 family protein [Shewanella marinintestina]|uniref:CIA30 family protein n=1 Tax=Shewanella marinintestina TaxID=190305 RepID=UPI00200E4150|nr:CIA30 family protein [Shewanella marinintestina]MCL1145406.1 CIA30 family protein [Shewanella marinintestina]